MSGASIDAGPLDAIDEEDLVRFDHAGRTYVVARDDAGGVFVADGLCTHEAVHLCEGFVFGRVVECPRHMGRFDLADGACKGGPVTAPIAVHETEVRGGNVFFRAP